jgi:pimeloyl-[acyl-carrier protein] methyl ester esterase
MTGPPPTLHVQSEGAGQDLVLLHGWGLHSGLWGTAAEQLAETFRVHRVDLPGHGHSGWNEHAGSLEGFARAVSAVLPERCILLGWSLGGLVALQISAEIARRRATESPQRVAALVLVCSTPKFLAAPDWPYGTQSASLDDFAQRLERDYPKTVRNFLTLQVQGEAHSLRLVRQMKQTLQSAPAPHPAALHAGLEILREADLREELPRITLPALVISGALDRTTPAAAGSHLAQHLPAGRFALFKQAAHAPFLSDPEAFAGAVVRFAGQNSPV